MAKKLSYILAVLISANLIASFLIVKAASNTTYGTLELIPCTSGCLSLSAFDSISPAANEPFFLSNAAKKLFMRTSGLQKLQINTSKQNYFVTHPADNVDDSGFTLDAQITVLSSSTPLPKELPTDPDVYPVLPKDNIGILTYNLDKINVLGGPAPDTPRDPSNSIHPVVSFDGNTFDQMKTNPENFYNYFTLFPSDNSGVNLVNAPLIYAGNPGYMGQYNYGVGIMFSFPENSLRDYNLREGNYHATLTFSLSS
jgi:hypothetical protein